jgi:hypothetical protein
MDNTWEKWFAWSPVLCNGKKVWLKYVYRKQISTLVSTGMGEEICSYWVYKNVN